MQNLLCAHVNSDTDVHFVEERNILLHFIKNPVTYSTGHNFLTKFEQSIRWMLFLFYANEIDKYVLIFKMIWKIINIETSLKFFT